MNSLAPYLLWIKLGAAVALVLAIFGAGHHYGSGSVNAKWDKSKAAQAAAENAAILKRTADNAALAAKQSETNSNITKAHDEELATVRASIANHRVRVGPAICGRSAARAQAESTSSGDAVDSSSRLVRQDLERDLRALEIRVEEALATGRACQKFVTENGLAP